MSERFALLRTTADSFDLKEAARALAAALNHPTAELLQKLSFRSGIFIENLPEQIAARCQHALQECGIATTLIPVAAIVDPPQPLDVTSAIIADESLLYRTETEQGVVPWTEFVWGDLIHVQSTSQEQVEEWSVGGWGNRLQRNQVPQLQFKKSQHMDLVSYDPWLLLRIQPQQFDWHSTGLVVQSSWHQNMLALAIAIGSRCTEAAFGAGLQWINDAAPPPDDHRVRSPEVYAQYLRWQLTLRFLDAATHT